MTTKEFMKLVKNRFEICSSLLEGNKDAEYTRNDDKLWNFKQAGTLMESSPEFALKGMWVKHIVSVFDMIDDLEENKLPSDLFIEDKITDMINYTLLLEGLIRERKENRTIEGFIASEFKNHPLNLREKDFKEKNLSDYKPEN